MSIPVSKGYILPPNCFFCVFQKLVFHSLQYNELIQNEKSAFIFLSSWLFLYTASKLFFYFFQKLVFHSLQYNELIQNEKSAFIFLSSWLYLTLSTLTFFPSFFLKTFFSKTSKMLQNHRSSTKMSSSEAKFNCLFKNSSLVALACILTELQPNFPPTLLFDQHSIY